MKYKTKHIGVGGMDCPCCRTFLKKSITKKLFNREYRRKTKEDIKNFSLDN